MGTKSNHGDPSLLYLITKRMDKNKLGDSTHCRVFVKGPFAFAILKNPI
jgi:hypothetical protein